MSLWTYKGWRVRKYHRHIKLITFLLLYSPFLVANGVYHFLNYENAMDSPVLYGAISFFGLLLPAFLCLVINVYLYKSFIFFGRLDNLRVVSNFLYEGGYYYQKKSKNGREKVKYPKVYLKRDKYGLDITFILQGNKFQDRFLNLGATLETMFNGDFMAKTFIKGFITYTVVLDHIEGRIDIKDVKVDSQGLRLMDDIYWNFDEQPHLLVSGGTGGGKTVTLMSIIKGLAEVGTVKILDPKKSDFVGLKDAPVFKGQVFFEKDDMIRCMEETVDEMNRRYIYMTKHREYAAGKRYSAYGLRPIFLIADEWAALMAEIQKDFKADSKVLDNLTQIVLKGRQAGVFMVLALQRPDGEYIKTSLRDNFMKRLSVGHLEDMGYAMMFGDANRNKVFKKIDVINGKKVRGRGYIANGGEIAQEFYSPYVPFDEGYSFLDEFMKMPPLGDDPSIHSRYSADNKDDEVNNEVDEIPSSVEDEQTFTTNQLSEKVDIPLGTLKKIISTISELTSKEFFKDDRGRNVFTEDDVVLFTSLANRKESFDGSWTDLVKEYFAV